MAIPAPTTRSDRGEHGGQHGGEDGDESGAVSDHAGPNVLHLLGPLAVLDPDGQPLGAVPAGRASLALQRIAVAGGSAVGVDALVDALWSDRAPASAARSVASLVSRIRAQVGATVIQGSAGSGYRLGLDAAWVTDALQAEQLLDESRSRARSAPALAASAARRGLSLLDRGDPLGGTAGLDDAWVDDFGRHIDGLRRRLRRSLWIADIELGRWSDLIDQAEVALEAEPHDEEAARALMTAHWNRGDRGSALHVHDRLREHLLEHLGVEPSNETEELYAAVIRDEPHPSPAEQPGDETPGAIVLAGRESEFGQLVAAWRRAAAGSVELVVLSGPAGSGRTTLCDAVAEEAQRTGGFAMRAESAEGERSLFLHPLLTMLSRLLLSTPPEDLPSLLGPWLPTASELIPELRDVVEVEPYQRSSADLEHRRALQAVEHVIREVAQRQPLVLLFDDLHLAGTSTVDALHSLVHDLQGLPVLIVAAVQPEPGASGILELIARGTNVVLGPISRRNVALLADAAGIPGEVDFVWELTEGHLLFVTEVIRSLRQATDREAIPGSLSSVVLHSVRRAGPEVEEVLEVAAFIGIGFDLATLSHVMERSEADLLVILRAAIDASLLRPRDGDFVFANRVIRDALYGLALGPVRRSRHARLVGVYADRPESRAWHLSRAGRLDDAAEAWLEAAQVAQRAFSNADADRLLCEAIETAQAAENTAVLGAALVTRGMVRTELGRYDEATQDHLAAQKLGLAQGNRPLQAQAVERLGWTAYYERDVEAAVARAEQATAMSGVHPSGWVLLGRIRHWSGDFDGASSAYTRALAELGDDDLGVRASALSCLGALLAHGDRFDEAVDALDDAVALCHEIGAFRPLLRGLFFQGLARANVGDLSGALTALETKKTLLHRYDVSFYRARTNTCLAWVWRELGDLDRARALSEQAVDESREVAESELQVEQELHALCSVAESDILAGAPDTAAAHLEVATELLSGWLPFRWRAELRVVELSSRLGLDSAERLLVEARDRGSSKYEALALNLLGRQSEAARVAAGTGSALLVAEVAPRPEADAAKEQIRARLPRQLRESFVTNGRLARQH